MALRSLILASKEMRTLLVKKANMMWIRSQKKSNLTPLGGGTGSLFELQTIKDNWETIPIFVTIFVALALPTAATAAFISNAQDLRFWPGSKMKNQTHRYILEGPPRPKKLMVINQKWEWPQGLIDALKQEEEDKSVKVCKNEVRSVSFKFWKKN